MYLIDVQYTQMYLHQTEFSILLSTQTTVVDFLVYSTLGKGTICERIKTKYGFTHLSTGDLLRDEVASGSSLGKELNTVMQSGKLVSNQQVLTLLKSAIEKNLSKSKGFLIDGYPREINQAIEFEKQISPCTMVFYFHCSDQVMIERLINRGKTSGRVDDNEETIRKRLQVFHENSDPILEYLKTKLAKIDSNKPVDTVFVAVENVLSKLI
ncbi:adenylate kinase isoenzyme 1-like protein [Dermatophagoides farinae]|uniref:Adenylate kinase isoenzyme 1-like protein n=1 Tax=Dermatophagoides farinae TaxID=6954 RepID=A0A9D4NTQ1_DERFA|nr:adenylate kinase isoenzyme 1-like protein [Dermatophagoides farinae]